MKTPSNSESNNTSTSTENQPSTSSEPVQEAEDVGENKEIDELMEETNKLLDAKAKSLNLSSLNVKSILHHLLKHPSTIDTLLGIGDCNDLPSVRNTRSRKRPGENLSVPSSAAQTPKKFSLRIEDKGPKNFLDVEYQEDDEYDEDYVEEVASVVGDGETGEEDEENDDEEEEDEYEGEEDHFLDGGESLEDLEVTEGEEASSMQIEDVDAMFYDDENDESAHLSHLSMTLNQTMPRSESTAPIPTLDIPENDYHDFVMSIKCPNGEFQQRVQYDTDDDEDYNVIAETNNLELDDWYETRQDRTTQIPRHEVRALMMDTLLAEKDIPVNAFPENAIILEEERMEKMQRRKEEMERQSFNHHMVETPESCSLIQKSNVLVTFSHEELCQLQTQMAQHVQLLTQFVVACHHDDELAYIRNDAQLMMNEMDDLYQAKSHYNTMFYVSNLQDAITTCHEINDFEKVDDEDFSEWNGSDDSQQGKPLRPEAIAVLARSKAILYPDLMLKHQPRVLSQNLPFLASENVMLALGLLQFGHLPRRAYKGTDRYTYISQYCLPARTAYKIRTHLKTMRRMPSKPTPIHAIIQAAEKGISKITMKYNHWRRIEGPLCTWPGDLQPAWYKLFFSRFVVTADDKIHRRSEKRLIVTPRKIRSEDETISDNGGEGDGEKGEDREEEFVTLGDGPGGQEIVMKEQALHELVMQLVKQSPSKRRKNSIPQKIVMMDVLEPEPLFSMSPEMAPDVPNKPSTSSTSSSEPSTSSVKNSRRNLTAKTQKQPTPPQEPPKIVVTTTTETEEVLETSFINPPTPGRGSPDEDLIDLESNSLTWFRTSHSVTMGNPRTPRGFVTASDPTDFSCMFNASWSTPGSPTSDGEDYFVKDCQAPMGMGRAAQDYVDEFSNDSLFHSSESTSSTGGSGAPATSEPIDEDSMTGLNMVPRELDMEEYQDDVDDEEEDDVSLAAGLRRQRRTSDQRDQKSRKRTRAQREDMGAIGLEDEELYAQQKAAVVRKVFEDVKQKLFMHMETFQKLSNAMSLATDSEKMSKTIQILSDYPELLHLVLLYAPPNSIPDEYQCNPMSQSYRNAVEMILDIERYVIAAKIKEPSIRGVFRYIISFLEKEPRLTDEQAARKFFQLLGQDRPLWRRLEKNFYCLPHRTRPRNVEKFEFVDLTKLETLSIRRDRKNVPMHFEVIEDIDQVLTSSTLRTARYDEKPTLIVKCGELCMLNEQSNEYVQLEVTERQWSRKDDITLLTRYNEAVRDNPQFEEKNTPSLVPELHFGTKSIVARLRYLLAELKAL